MIASVLWIALAIAAGPVSTAPQRGVIHKITDKGETYEDLAEHYYGKRHLAAQLRLFNRRAEPLGRGTTIIIPTYSLVPVKPKQTLKEFAEQNLADPARADYLAELHDLRGKEKVTPKPGTRLKVVQSLKHLVRPGESLKTIARLYYRDAGGDRIKLLVLYNKMSNAAVKTGMSIRIPLDGPEFNHAVVSARAKRPFERANETPAPVASTLVKRKINPTPIERDPPATVSNANEAAGKERPPPAFDEAMETIERACDDGEYAACESDAHKLIEGAPSLPATSKVELYRLRACALVAMGRVDESKESFRALLKLDPEYDLDLYRTSPKILDVFQAVAER